MPVTPTYPGVYVEEIRSGVRPITGVATSITAFIGRAARGPTNEATIINSFADFERKFGGLWINSNLGFAVRDFFQNGGGQAIIVRLYNPGKPPAGAPAGTPAGTPAVAPGTKHTLTAGELKFEASSEGQWGVNLRVTVDVDNISADVAKDMGVTTGDLFNLTVRDTGTNSSERFVNLTVIESPRRVDNVLAGNSNLLRYQGSPSIPAAQTSLNTLWTDSKALQGLQKTLTDKQDAKAAQSEIDKAQKAVDEANSNLVKECNDDLGAKEQLWADAQRKLRNKQNAEPTADLTTEKQAVTDTKKDLDDALPKALAAVSDGLPLAVADFLPANGMDNKQGLYALEQADLFNLLCIPPYRASADALDWDVNLISAAAAYCETRRAMLLVDAPKDWNDKDNARTKFLDPTDRIGTKSRNAALFFPRLKKANTLHDNQIEVFAASGAIAGIFARTDSQRGVWKAPAGNDAAIVGASGLSVQLTDPENGELNPLGINCLRSFPLTGPIVWGSRTLRGADELADEYKYIPVRRTALYIEESLYRGLKWVIFEPNDEPLWSQIRLNAGAFMHNLFRQGAFQGASSRDAYFVRCDKTTNPQDLIDLGVVTLLVGFAPLKPAEFLVIQIQQMAGQIQV